MTAITITRNAAALRGLLRCNVIIRNQEEGIEVSLNNAKMLFWSQPKPDGDIIVLIQLPTGRIKYYTLFSILSGQVGALPTLLLYDGVGTYDFPAPPTIDPAALADFLS